MNTLTERGALTLLSLPTLMYASGCLFVTPDFVAMIPVSFQFPGVTLFVRVLGLALLASGILIHVGRFRGPAGLALALCMAVTAFCIHLPTLFVDFPDMSADMVELMQRTAVSGVVKDLGLVGAGLLVARLAREGRP